MLADQPGYLLYVTGTVQRWKKARRILPGTVTQDGDDEGVLRLDRLPTPAEADTIRDVVGIRRRRHMTAEALANLERARKAIKSPVPEPGSVRTVLLAMPPDTTIWWPPSLTVAPWATPPEEMVSEPPLEMVPPLSEPPG